MNLNFLQYSLHFLKPSLKINICIFLCNRGFLWNETLFVKTYHFQAKQTIFPCMHRDERDIYKILFILQYDLCCYACSNVWTDKWRRIQWCTEQWLICKLSQTSKSYQRGLGANYFKLSYSKNFKALFAKWWV